MREAALMAIHKRALLWTEKAVHKTIHNFFVLIINFFYDKDYG